MADDKQKYLSDISKLIESAYDSRTGIQTKVSGDDVQVTFSVPKTKAGPDLVRAALAAHVAK